MDVQGAEFSILKGATRLLSNKKIKYIYFEIIVSNVYEGTKPTSYYFELLESY